MIYTNIINIFVINVLQIIIKVSNTTIEQKKEKKLKKRKKLKNVEEVSKNRCVEWIGKRSRREIGRAIDFFPLTGNKPPSQTVAPLCFEASVNLAGFLAAAVIRNLARINRSYKSLFPLSIRASVGRGSSLRKHGRTGAGNVSLFRNRRSGSKRAITLLLRARKLAGDERTSGGRPIYIYIYDDVCYQK